MFAGRYLKPLPLGSLVRRYAQQQTDRSAVQPRTGQAQDVGQKPIDWYEQHGVHLDKQRLKELDNQIRREDVEAEKIENDEHSDVDANYPTNFFSCSNE